MQINVVTSHGAARIAGGVFCLSFAVTTVLAQPSDKDDVWTGTKEVLNYTLTMQKVDKVAGATRGLITYSKVHPEILNKVRAVENVQFKKLDDLVAYGKANAREYVAIVESNGISFREYMLVIGSLGVTLFVVDRTENSNAPVGALPVNPANIAFVKANQAKLRALFEEFDAMARNAS